MPVRKKIRDWSGPVLDRLGPEPWTGPVLTLVYTDNYKQIYVCRMYSKLAWVEYFKLWDSLQIVILPHLITDLLKMLM